MNDLPNIFLFLSLPFTLFGISTIYKNEKIWLVGISSTLLVLWKFIDADVPLGFIVMISILSSYFILSYVKPLKTYGEWTTLNSILKNRS